VPTKTTATVDDRRARRHAALIDAAVKLLGEQGRQAVTHRAVAEEAGVPLGATTYYFDSRDDLLAQALRSISAGRIENAGSVAEDLLRADTPERLADELVEWLVEAVDPSRNLYVAEFELWLEAARRPELREAARDWCAAERSAFEKALEALGSEDPERDARIVAGALDGLAGMALMEPKPIEAARATRPELRRLIEALVG
jgi:TetR/AcrR family transcriptional regulator, regulator of biofilm formation and stress response